MLVGFKTLKINFSPASGRDLCRAAWGQIFVPTPTIPTTLIPISTPILAIVSTSSPPCPRSNHPRPYPSPQTIASIPIPINDGTVISRFATTHFMLKRTANSKQCGNAEWPVQQNPQKIQPSIAEIDNMGDI